MSAGAMGPRLWLDPVSRKMGVDELDRPPQDIVRSWAVISRVKSVLTSSVIENIHASILSERLLDEVIDSLVQLRIIKSSACDQ